VSHSTLHCGMSMVNRARQTRVVNVGLIGTRWRNCVHRRGAARPVDLRGGTV
jgi:hypothetical protein